MYICIYICTYTAPELVAPRGGAHPLGNIPDAAVRDPASRELRSAAPPAKYPGSRVLQYGCSGMSVLQWVAEE